MTKITPPQYLSPTDPGVDVSAAHAGAALQRQPMTPQGLTIAAVLEDVRENGITPRYKKCVVQVPRRSTKTTAIQNTLLGRCLTIPGYSVASTAQDGTRASEFMRELMDLIKDHAAELLEHKTGELAEWAEQTGEKPPEYTLKHALSDLGIRQLYYSQQREFIKFNNGSKWRVVKPEASGLRGGKADVIWIDEGGELDTETSPALLAGALPLMDTRPRGQVIISGTPGDVRAGAFWDALEAGHADPETTGIVDWSASEIVDPADESVWWEVHPGLASGLTSIDVIRERFRELEPEKFKMEYLCVWPVDSTKTALSLHNWALTERQPQTTPPDDTGQSWTIGFDVDPAGIASAVAVAWYDADGNPWVQIARHRGGGSQWLTEYLLRPLAKYKRVQIAYDSIGQNIAIADALRRKPRVRQPQIKALTMKDAGAGTAQISQALDRLTLAHAAHPGLDAAVKVTTWRESGGTRLFRANGGEITTLRAAVAALSALGKTPERDQRKPLPRIRQL